METTNTNHKTSIGSNTAEKTMNDTGKDMMDTFTKNLNLITDFYSNLFNSLSSGNNGFNNNNGASFNSMNNDFTKLFSNPFSGMGNSFSNQSLPTFNNIYQQMMDYNTNLFSMLSKGMNTNTNWSEVSKKEETIVENRLDTIKNMRHSILESYNKQLDSVNENNRKMLQETTDQFNLLMKQNQQLWTSIFSMNLAPLKSEEKIVKDPILKDPIVNEVKKRSLFPVSDHKI